MKPFRRYSRRERVQQQQQQQRYSNRIQQASVLQLQQGQEQEQVIVQEQEQDEEKELKVDANNKEGRMFDELLRNVQLKEAMLYLQRHYSSIVITKERWNLIFDTIEQRTMQAEENHEVNTRKLAEFPLTSEPRMDMSNMYQTLRNLKELQLFGAIDCAVAPPAGGSKVVVPSLLEEITELSMKSLTPKPTNSLVWAGFAVAIAEGLMSLLLGININFLVFVTVFIAATDQIFINGAISQSVLKLFSPGIQTKIQKHEAGHFLCAYLLGCPVEGCVLSPWDALTDARFGAGRQITAGTSFFDPILSEQMNSRQKLVTRSSIDRYSIIVMGGIAAEAVAYGQADGGAGDEMALIAFLSNLNGGSGANAAAVGSSPRKMPWNNVSIRNQARWGALQAVLILRHYKPCYDALVKALDEKKSLGECIYAIEQAGRENNLGPLTESLGYIIEKTGTDGDYEEWTTNGEGSDSVVDSTTTKMAMMTTKPTSATVPVVMDQESSVEALKEYRKIMEKKLSEIEDRLDEIKDT